MTAPVSCPNCEQPVNPEDRYCEHCGADLAVAAAIATHKVELPITPEILVPRLGEYLIEKSHLTHDQLDQALAYQKRSTQNGTPKLLGQVLRELDLVDANTIDQVITEQILELQSVLRQTNRQLEQRVEERTRALHQALARLTELNQLKANFIANISHELRTPLAHLKGYLDLFIEGGFGPLNDSQVEAMKIMHRAELRLEKLIEDLISFSIASRGEIALDLSLTSLDAITRGSVEAVVRRAQQNQVELQLEIQPDLQRVQCDEQKISWVVGQLLDNALKFTPKGGKVSLALTQTGLTETFSIQDTGIGIPANRLDEIFEPFHQLDSSATRRYGGTGLGLALCRQILEAHGSTLEVQSVVGAGSTFTFQLPVSRDGYPGT
jgi:signal transduction histidine kinase